MHKAESNVDIPPIPHGKKESKLIRIKRTSGQYEYLTPEELEILNIQKRERKIRGSASKDRIRFVGMLFLAVVVITVMKLYINYKDRPVYDVIQQSPAPVENRKPVIIPKVDDINKIEPENITDVQLIARKSPATISVKEIIATPTAGLADETPAALADDNHTETVEVIDDNALIANVLNRWSDAWSNQRIEEYLLFYHDDFQPAQNMKKQSWIKDRWSKISRPAWIKVIITGVEIDLLDGNNARALFKQQYKSPNYQDTALKTIHLFKTGAHWKIIREESVKL